MRRRYGSAVALESIAVDGVAAAVAVAANAEDVGFLYTQRCVINFMVTILYAYFY